MYSGLIRMAILIQEITTFAEIHLIMQVVLGATQPILKEDGKIANQVNPVINRLLTLSRLQGTFCCILSRNFEILGFK